MKHLFSILFASCVLFQHATAQQVITKPKRSDAVIAVITDEEIAVAPSFRSYCQMLETKEALGVYAVGAKWKNPEQVRSTIHGIRKNYPALEGLVLIGNIPVAMIRNAQHMTTAFKMDEIKYDRKQSSVASDRFYDDYDLKFRSIGQDSTNALWFYYELEETGPQVINSDLYTGRIMSHATGTDRIKEISTFLDKAVAARAVKNPLDQMLAFTGYAYNSESITSWSHEQFALQESMPALFNNPNGYRALHFSMDQKMKYRLYTELQRPGLDLTLFTEHGDIEQQYINGELHGEEMEFATTYIKYYLRSALRKASNRKQDVAKTKASLISKYNLPEAWFEGAFNNDSLRIADSLYASEGQIFSAELRKINPTSRMVIFNACYNGSFHHPDNISAGYLFGNGQTLVTHGNTTNVLQDKWTIEHIGLLERGARAGQWSRLNNTLESSLNGDPTYHYDHAQSAAINKMLAANHPLAYWQQQLAQQDIIYKMIAMRRINEAAPIVNGRLFRKIYNSSASRNVRMEALKLLSTTGDSNYLAVAAAALQDPYELIRRKSAEWMAKAGHPQLIAPLLDLLIDYPNDARTVWVASRALMLMDAETLQKNIEAKKKKTGFEYNHQITEQLQSILENAKKDGPELLKAILNKEAKEESRIQRIRTLRNMYYHHLIPQFIPVVLDANEPVEIRKNMIEALGWFSNSYNKSLIIDACKKLIADNATADVLKAEAHQTMGRLHSWILP